VVLRRRDGWNEDGVFLYTGEGQAGDMQFVRGNKAIRDQLANGKDLLLFEQLGKGNGYRFLGNFACASWEWRTGPDKDRKPRRVIVFHLLREGHVEEPRSEATAHARRPLNELRRKAYEASTTKEEKDTRETRRRYYERSAAVRAYVLARANGTCEACRKTAPFTRADGSPYLEPHHTRRLSDGGPDDPQSVGGICPNCHREIHCGVEGPVRNRTLQEYIATLEESYEM
jgi:5-methylcytosine-specific restriction enzyme A